MKQVLVLFTVLFALRCSSEPQEVVAEQVTATQDTPAYELSYMLEKWADSFVAKVDSSYTASINFKVTDSAGSYQVNIADKTYELRDEVRDSANFIFSSSLEHYNKIFNAEITAMTSMGQATSADPIPLEPEILKPVTDNVVNDFLFFAQRFFNTSPYDRVKLGLEHSRVVHGGHAIPIFYQKTEDIGVRSAWYQINQGEQVNEIGDTNPFPQYFIINAGKGFAKIGSDTVAIQANEAYFIPPDHDHVFWNESEEPLVMIFLAWGKGA